MKKLSADIRRSVSVWAGLLEPRPDGAGLPLQYHARCARMSLVVFAAPLVRDDGVVVDLSVLSAPEFEELCRDLLAAEFCLPVSSFVAGPDGGVDLRWTTSSGSRAVGQCKHYGRSGFDALFRSLRSLELDKVRALAPDEYWVATSVELTPERKDKIYRLFGDWMVGPDCVIGAHDVDGLLRRHPQVLRYHLKLLLGDSARLAMFLNSDTYNRTADRIDRINESLPVYVVTEAHQQAREMLAAHRVCIVSGEPGAGKTTLAQMLVAEAIHEGYELVDVAGGITDAWRMLRPRAKQVFLFDDFLGELRFDWLGRDVNDIVRLIERVARSSSTLLVMTTREYILRDAALVREKLGRLDPKYRFLLDVGLITPERAARMVFNHLWHAELPPPSVEVVAHSDFSAVAYHPAFNPRVVETCSTRAWVGDGSAYPGRLCAALDHPDELWQTAFTEYLDGHARALLYSLAVQPQPYAWPAPDLLRKIYDRYVLLARACGIAPGEIGYQHAMAVLEESFIRVGRDDNREARWIGLRNPSITAFVLGRLCRDMNALKAVLESADDVRVLDVLVTGLQMAGPRVVQHILPEFHAVVIRLGRDPAKLEDLLLFNRSLAPEWTPGGTWLDEAVGTYAQLLMQRHDCQPTETRGLSLLAAFAGSPLLGRLHAAIDQHLGPFGNWNYGDYDWEALASHLDECREIGEACPLERGVIEDAFDHFARGLLSAAGRGAALPLTTAADLNFLTTYDGNPDECIDGLRASLGFAVEGSGQLPLFEISQAGPTHRSPLFGDTEFDEEHDPQQASSLRALFLRLFDRDESEPSTAPASDTRLQLIGELPDLA